MNLHFDFTVDKSTATIYITREFAAGIDLVWDAFTKSELLDQWFAPQPWRLETKEMNFTPGGRWLYAMVSPENQKGWSLVEFLEINPKTLFTSRNAFSDENGNINPAVTSMNETQFTPSGNHTTVKIAKQLPDLAQLEKFVAMGYKQGMEVCLTALDKLLADKQPA